MQNNQLNNYLQTAIAASIKAGSDILEVYAQPIAVETKDDKSPLTLADKKSHLQIVEGLAVTGLPVLSEEGKQMPYDERAGWNPFWLVDPLDGTKEFIKRNGEFTVNIALIENNFPVAGVIYVPVLKELYFAAEGLGSYKCENINVGDTLFNSPGFLDALIAQSKKLSEASRPEKFSVVASRSHLTTETEELINELKQKHGEIDLVSKGSSLKLCLVAEGKAHIYPRLAPTMEWDTAAGQAIAELAGCSVINYESKQRMQYNKENLLNPWFVVAAN